MNTFHLANGSTVYRIDYPVADLAWIAPSHHKNIYFFGVGGGGGGGAGCGGAQNTQRGGGAGGTKGFWASVLLANRFNQPFYLTVGTGGTGGSGGSGAGGTGGDAGTTYVHYKTPWRGFGTPGRILTCQGGRGNTGGTTTAGGTGGSYGNAQPGSAWWTIWYGPINTAQIGNGPSGSANGNGSQSIADYPSCHGASGAGCPSGSYTAANGGQVFSDGPLATVLGGIGDPTLGGNGNPGDHIWVDGIDSYFLFSKGGSGGGNSNTGPGGNGGKGGLGSGGGGGGGGATGGNGGAGGNGALIIITW